MLFLLLLSLLALALIALRGRRPTRADEFHDAEDDDEFHDADDSIPMPTELVRNTRQRCAYRVLSPERAVPGKPLRVRAERVPGGECLAAMPERLDLVMKPAGDLAWRGVQRHRGLAVTAEFRFVRAAPPRAYVGVASISFRALMQDYRYQFEGLVFSRARAQWRRRPAGT